MKQLMRTVLVYSAMALGVMVGGVIVGAVVIAPAVSRAKPFLARSFSFSSTQQTEGTGGAVGQADGDPMASATSASMAVSNVSMPGITAVEPFRPMAEVLAASRGTEQVVLTPQRRTGVALLAYRGGELLVDAKLAVGRVPKILWIFADIGGVLLMAGLWFWRRRRMAQPAMANLLVSKKLDVRSAASLSSKLVSGKSSRTPKAVAALAEAGNSPADIARRTGLALDAVAMLMSMGSFGARQLQPPTA